jgi:F-box protein 21
LGTRFANDVRKNRRPSCDRLRLAQDTIEIVTDPDLIPKQLFFLAGKFFKRFDRETCTFVSNIKEFYPDD